MEKDTHPSESAMQAPSVRIRTGAVSSCMVGRWAGGKPLILFNLALQLLCENRPGSQILGFNTVISDPILSCSFRKDIKNLPS